MWQPLVGMTPEQGVTSVRRGLWSAKRPRLSASVGLREAFDIIPDATLDIGSRWRKPGGASGVASDARRVVLAPGSLSSARPTYEPLPRKSSSRFRANPLCAVPRKPAASNGYSGTAQNVEPIRRTPIRPRRCQCPVKVPPIKGAHAQTDVGTSFTARVSVDARSHIRSSLMRHQRPTRVTPVKGRAVPLLVPGGDPPCPRGRRWDSHQRPVRASPVKEPSSAARSGPGPRPFPSRCDRPRPSGPGRPDRALDSMGRPSLNRNTMRTPDGWGRYEDSNYRYNILIIQ